MDSYHFLLIIFDENRLIKIYDEAKTQQIDHQHPENFKGMFRKNSKKRASEQIGIGVDEI
jgi:hypothetical protein